VTDRNEAPPARAFTREEPSQPGAPVTTARFMRTPPYLRSPTPLKEAARARPFEELRRALVGGSLVSKLTMLVVLVGVTRIALRPAEVQHDVAMYLQAGELLLRGQRPYVDFIDVNPPLIMYLSAIPAALAAALRTPVVPTALLLVALLAAWSLATARRTLIDTFEDADIDPRIAEVAILALACAFFLSDAPERLDLPFPGNPSPDPRLSAIFAQREHLFMIGALPFLAVRFRRWEGGRIGLSSAVVTGCIASVVTCLKPQLIILLVAFEIGVFASKRRWSPVWSPEVLAFALVALAYAAHFALLPAAIKTAWFGRWLPFVVRGYGVFNEGSYWDLAARCWPAAVALAVAFGVTLAGNSQGQRLIRAFALMAAAGAALYVLQKKGWTYHAFPERTAVLVVLMASFAGVCPIGASGDVGARVVVPFTRERVGHALGALVALASLACVVCLLRIDTPKDVDRLRRRSQIMRTIDTFTKEGDAVLVATTSVWDPYPALTLQNRRPGSRYLWLFPIPMMQAVPDDGGATEAAFVRDLADDLRERRPTLLLLQTGRCFGCKSTSVDAFFREHPPLASALQDYSLRGTVRDGQELQVFVRTSSGR
jgi:hypothetical protein